MDVEEAMFRAFIREERVERYVALLKTRRKREKVIFELDHFYDLVGPCTFVEKADQSPEGVYRLLRQRGAPDDCYVMSSIRKLDQREMPLREALQEVVCSCMGTFISCIPGQLAYYEGEEVTSRHILERTPR